VTELDLMFNSSFSLGKEYREKLLKVERRFYLTIDHLSVMRVEANYSKELEMHFVYRSQGVMLSMVDVLRVNYVRVTKILRTIEGCYKEIEKKFRRVSLFDNGLTGDIKRLDTK